MANDKAGGGGRTGADTTLSAGNRRRLQARTERKDGFGAARRQVFLDHLAACCNVRLAAAAVFMPRRARPRAPRPIAPTR